MKEKVAKPKKIGNGFGLRITQAVLFFLLVIGFAVGAIVWYTQFNYGKSFVTWMSKSYYSGYEVDLNKDGSYEDGCYIYANPYTNNYINLKDYSGQNIVEYKFVSENMKTKELTFRNEATNETLTVKFSQIQHYDDFIAIGGWSGDFDPVVFGILTGLAGFFAVIAALQTVSAFLGKKRKWANNLSIIFGSVCLLAYGFGVFGLIGGIQGRKALKAAANQPQEQPQAEDEGAAVSAEQPVQTVQTASPVLEKGNSVEEARCKVLADYPVDYENKPAVSRLLDMDNRENLFLENEDGNSYEFHQLYVTLCGGKIYALTETVGLSEEEGGGLIVFRVDYESDTFHIEEDDALCESVLEEYKHAVNAAYEYDKQEIKRSDFKLDLYDSNIDEKTWKEFKKTASQEELAVIAIGAKYRVAHSRIKNIIYAIGIILSILLFWPTGGWSLIGYPVFAFLATKSIRYEDTYNQSYRKLNKEFRTYVDNYYNGNIGLKILDCIIKIAIFWITIPYQAILLLIGTFAPNFVISKNGILVSIPNGHDVGNLGAIGAYYASFSFIDEALDNRQKSSSGASGSPTDDYYKKKEYTYTDSHGYEQTVYSDDEKNFYDVGGHYVGSTEDGKFKKKD